MKFSNTDFQLMRWSITAISVSAVLSAIILYGSREFADHAQKDFRTAQNQMNNARSRLNTARQDQEYLAAYSKDYSSLEGRDILGDEHRLDWMEGLDKLRSQNLVINFNYNIAPQKLYSPQPALDSGNLNINYSEMKLQFDLLHEGQLLNFLSALRSQIKGQYQLENCTMQRATTNGANDADDDEDDTAPATATNIKAECSGGWITLKNRNAQS